MSGLSYDTESGLSGTGPPDATGGADDHHGTRRDQLGPPGREIALSATGLMLTATAAVGLERTLVTRVSNSGQWWTATGFAVLVATLVWGALAFQIARLGFHRRRRHPAPEPDRAYIFDGVERGLLALVPSLSEDPEVVLRTLASAALQAYPGMHVVLLIDDSPDPEDGQRAELLSRARHLPAFLRDWLEEPRLRATSAQERLEALRTTSAVATDDDVALVAGALDEAARWFEEQAAEESGSDHENALFRRLVLAEPADGLKFEAAELRQRFQNDLISRVELEWRMRRLVARFDTRIDTFERKRYTNLSHEPNKAMNLNSYLGLLGRTWREADDGEGIRLEECDDGWHVAEPEFVMTLDADTILANDYAERLIGCMHQPGRQRVAVIQTPHSAVPDAPTRIGRVIGATTDIRYNTHQGLEAHDAQFWFDSSSIIRTVALRDLEQPFTERGHHLKRYLSGRTAIDTTESSLDLALAGWQIHNHPQRLSFSSTARDFGSLVIDRRRRANGGLVLLSRLRTLVSSRRASPLTAMLRGHYLLSITVTTIALVALLNTRMGISHVSWWLPVAAIPYLALYARDLHQAGYPAADAGRVYALNLLLIPTHLAGLVASVRELLTGRAAAPRVRRIDARTPTPAWLHLASLAMLVALAHAAGRDFGTSHYPSAILAGVNALVLGYAITAFVGWRNLFADLLFSVTGRFRSRTQRTAPPRAPLEPTLPVEISPTHTDEDQQLILPL